MRVKVHYLGLVRRKMGKSEEELKIKAGSSLLDLLDEIAKVHGENLKGLIDAEKGNIIDPTYVVTVNGISANQMKGTKTILNDGDKVAIMTLISGGSSSNLVL